MLFRLIDDLDLALSQLDDPSSVQVRIFNDEKGTADLIRQKIASVASSNSFSLVQNSERLGLSKNLVEAASGGGGTSEFLWVFGNDDRFESPDVLAQVIRELLDEKSDLLILGKGRFADGGAAIEYSFEKTVGSGAYTFWEFCEIGGWISGLGFISNVIMRRSPAISDVAALSVGTMYPLLFGLTLAHHTGKVRVRSDIRVLQRTIDSAKKFKEADPLAGEQDFFGPERDAVFFGSRFIEGFDILSRRREFNPDELFKLLNINEPIWNKSVILFLIDNCFRAQKIGIELPPIRHVSWLRGFTPDPTIKTRIQHLVEASQSSDMLESRLSFSLVTPCKGNEFLQECVQSVELQSGALLKEHIVVDAGDAQETEKILVGVPKVRHVVSADSGQSEALNRGFESAIGDILCWLNADDYFIKATVFEEVETIFRLSPEVDVVFGDANYVDREGGFLRKSFVHTSAEDLFSSFLRGVGIAQPSVFFRRDVFERFGPLRESLHYSMDYDFWIRLALRGAVFRRHKSVLSAMRYHPDSKTVRDRKLSFLEVMQVMRVNYGWVPKFWISQLAAHLVRGGDGIIPLATAESHSEKSEIERTFLVLNLDLNGSNFRAMRRREFLDSATKAQRDKIGVRVTFRQRIGQNLRGLLFAKSHKLQDPISLGWEMAAREIAAIEESLSRDIASSRSSARCGPGSPGGKLFKERSIDGLTVSLSKEDHANFLGEFSVMVQQQRSQNRSRTCVIAGNGPSLNLVDWSLLDSGDVDVIASNKAYLHQELIKRARFYTVVNRHVAEQSDFEIQCLDGPIRILPWWLSYAVPPKKKSFYCEAIGTPEFSQDIQSNISWRHTVTFFNLQLAAGLGYRRIVLVGMDHSYSQPLSAQEGEKIKQTGPDLNHFSPRYFQDQYWQAASSEKMGEMYQLAQNAFEQLGVECFNATTGGALEVFPRISLREALFR